MFLPGTSRSGLGTPRNGVSWCTEPLSRCTLTGNPYIKSKFLDVPYWNSEKPVPVHRDTRLDVPEFNWNTSLKYGSVLFSVFNRVPGTSSRKFSLYLIGIAGTAVPVQRDSRLDVPEFNWNIGLSTAVFVFSF